MTLLPIQLKPMPTFATKEQIRTMYNIVPYRTMTSIMQYAVDAINEDSNVPTTKKAQVLNSRHITLIVKELGPPPGYDNL